MGETQAAFGEGAGFIGADIRDTPDVFDRHRSSNQCMPPGQAVDAKTQERR